MTSTCLDIVDSV